MRRAKLPRPRPRTYKMDIEVLNADIDSRESYPRRVLFRPAYSGGIMYADGITIPEPVSVNGEDYPAGTRLPVVVDLSSVQLDNNTPILYSHNPMLRIGHTESVTTDGTTIEAVGYIDSPSDWGEEVVETFRQGAKWQVSIGSGIINIEDKKTIKQNEKIEVNGQTLTGPFILLNNLMVREISIVPAGADPHTEALLGSINMEGMYTMTFDEFIASKGFDMTTLTEDNKAALEALWKELTGPEDLTAEAEGPPDEEKETIAAEACAPEDKKETVAAEACADAPEDKKETVQAGIRSARSLNTPASSAYRTRGFSVAEPSKRDVLQASALLSMGVPADWLASKGGLNRRAVDRADSGGCGSMLELMGEVLKASGITPDYRNAGSVVRAYRECLQASNVGTTTLGDTNIFSPIIDKRMRYQYENLESVWKTLLSRRVVRDFNEVATVNYDLLAQAKDLIENEDFPVAELRSDGAKYAVTKQGVTLALSYEKQINDDLGALSRIGDALLDAIVFAQDTKFWSLFWAQNSTIFTTTKGNKITKVLGIDGLSLARKAFGSMKRANGRFLHVPPTQILVPLALADKAQELFEWQWAGENNTRGNINVGRYKVLTDPYVGSEGGYTGASDTGWFMLGDTAKYPLGEYSVLTGQENPGIKETWYDHKDAVNLRALGTVGFCLYEENVPAVYSTGTAS